MKMKAPVVGSWAPAVTEKEKGISSEIRNVKNPHFMVLISLLIRPVRIQRHISVHSHSDCVKVHRQEGAVGLAPV